MVRVLFVCLGNICRSPLAEGIFRARAAERGLRVGPDGDVDCDSAGTGSWHVGEPPDPRSVAAARRAGVDISNQRARQVRADDFTAFDFLIAMDRSNLANLSAHCPPEREDRVALFLSFAGDGPGGDLPDPYYGGEEGFQRCLQLVEEASAGFLDHLSDQGLIPGTR